MSIERWPDGNYLLPDYHQGITLQERDAYRDRVYEVTIMVPLDNPYIEIYNLSHDEFQEAVQNFTDFAIQIVSVRHRDVPKKSRMRYVSMTTKDIDSFWTGD